MWLKLTGVPMEVSKIIGWVSLGMLARASRIVGKRVTTPIPVFPLQSTQPMFSEFVACRDYSFPQSKVVKSMQLSGDEYKNENNG